MSQRPAYTLISHLRQIKLTKDDAKEFINDFEQVKESLTLGLNSLGVLMAIAASEDNDIGVSPSTLVDASWLITTLCDFIQACDEQENDCLKYVDGEFSQRESMLAIQKQRGENENAQHS